MVHLSGAAACCAGARAATARSGGIGLASGVGIVGQLDAHNMALVILKWINHVKNNVQGANLSVFFVCFSRILTKLYFFLGGGVILQCSISICWRFLRRGKHSGDIKKTKR